MEQVQSFLPQMAQANEKLREEMAAAPPGHFNIENTDGTLGKVIQMVTASFSSHAYLQKEEDALPFGFQVLILEILQLLVLTQDG